MLIQMTRMKKGKQRVSQPRSRRAAPPLGQVLPHLLSVGASLRRRRGTRWAGSRRVPWFVSPHLSSDRRRSRPHPEGGLFHHKVAPRMMKQRRTYLLVPNIFPFALLINTRASVLRCTDCNATCLATARFTPSHNSSSKTSVVLARAR